MKKKDLLALLTTLGQEPKQLTRKHLKKIYALLIASGQPPRCPWCDEPIYNIKDFTWDHIIPKSEGGDDDISNLQPMHKTCNNEKKENTVYKTDYTYDICDEIKNTVFTVQIKAIYKKRPDETNKKHKKDPYKNLKRNSGKSR